MAESEGFEPPIALRLCLISSQVHSTGLCQLSVPLSYIEERPSENVAPAPASLDRPRNHQPRLDAHTVLREPRRHFPLPLRSSIMAPMKLDPLLRRAAVVALLAAAIPLFITPPAAAAQAAPSASTPAKPTGLLSQDELEKLLPPSVFFKGQSAPLQLRNAAAIRYPGGAILFASLVDNSGYSTGVRERYQFYLVTETPITIADKQLAPGAYGAGFLDDGSFLIMDIGGHDVMSTATTADDTMHRPRPLQIIVGSTPTDFRLYLGRRYAVLHHSQQP